MFPETMADKGSLKLTLADIAERAGVSRSLASLALRGEPGVQREKRARILKIAAELNYTPNPAAQNLASNLSRTVGILVADILNPYLAHLAKTIDGAARAKGFSVVLSVDGTPDDAAERAITNLVAQRIAGVILIGAPDDIKIVEKVARRVPVVYVGRHLEAEAIDSVSNDDHLGASLLVRHLVECGHKVIAHIDGGRGAGARRRREGFQVAMHAHGLEPQVIPGRYTLDGVARRVPRKHWRSNLGRPPSSRRMISPRSVSLTACLARDLRYPETSPSSDMTICRLQPVRRCRSLPCTSPSTAWPRSVSTA
jgi:DNA-binding LacI/PurR family transcriptional regulator